MIIVICNDDGKTEEKIHVLDKVVFHKDVGHGRLTSIMAAAIQSYRERMEFQAKDGAGFAERQRALTEMLDIVHQAEQDAAIAPSWRKG